MVGQVTAIESFQQFQEVINCGKPVLIDFWATWCGPCRVISPIFEKFAAAAPEGILFYKVDADAQEDIAQELAIRSLPTFHLFKDGKIVKTAIGANPPAVEALVKEATSLV